MESGVGIATWAESAAMWTTFAGLVGEATAALVSEVMALTANWQGGAPAKLAGVSGLFMGWLDEMEAVAAANALACLGVVNAYGVVQGSMIPVPAVTSNRVSEMVAEATNFFGINNGLILFLNQQYGQYWTQNASTMMTYDEAVQIATIPKPSTPPPPLADATQAVPGAEALTSLGTSSVTDPLMSALQAGQTPTEGAQAPTEMMSSLTQSVPQMLQAPGQALGQLSGSGNSLTSPFQSLLSPFQSLMTDTGSTTAAQNPEALIGAGPWSTAFTNPGSTPGMSGALVSGSGGSPALGGGLGGNMLPPQGPYPSSGQPVVKSQQVFSGVPTSRPEFALSPASASTSSTAPAGAGMGPVAPHAPAHSNNAAQRRDSDLVIALNPIGGTTPDRRL